jgi:hypothetical protein
LNANELRNLIDRLTDENEALFDIRGSIISLDSRLRSLSAKVNSAGPINFTFDCNPNLSCPVIQDFQTWQWKWKNESGGITHHGPWEDAANYTRDKNIADSCPNTLNCKMIVLPKIVSVPIQIGTISNTIGEWNALAATATIDDLTFTDGPYDIHPALARIQIANPLKTDGTKVETKFLGKQSFTSRLAEWLVAKEVSLVKFGLAQFGYAMTDVWDLADAWLKKDQTEPSIDKVAIASEPFYGETYLYKMYESDTEYRFIAMDYVSIGGTNKKAKIMQASGGALESDGSWVEYGKESNWIVQTNIGVQKISYKSRIKHGIIVGLTQFTWSQIPNVIDPADLTSGKPVYQAVGSIEDFATGESVVTTKGKVITSGNCIVVGGKPYAFYESASWAGNFRTAEVEDNPNVF